MVRKGKLGILATVLVLLASLVMPLAAAQAQTSPVQRAPLNLMTSPLPLNIVTKPGQTVTSELRVKNNGTRPERLKVELLKFSANGETGSPQIKEREPKDTYFDWVSFSETNFLAEPNVWKTVKMTIKTPKEAAFGYYLAVLFSRAAPDKPTGGASGVEGGVASLVLLNVDAPGAKREAQVAEFIATKKVYEFLPADFSVRMKNPGNVHVAPAGNIFVKRGDTQVAALEFNGQRGNILPQTNRVFEQTWNDGFPRFETKGTGSTATQELTWNFQDLQKLRFGKYTATLVAVYDDGQRDIPVEAVVSFWVIPWRILGGLLLILLLVGVGVWAVFRSIWKGIRRRPGGPEGSVPAQSEQSAEPQEQPSEQQVSPIDHPVALAQEKPLPSAPPLPTEPQTLSAPVVAGGSAPIVPSVGEGHGQPARKTEQPEDGRDA